MKILYVTTIGSTMRFFVGFIKQLIDEGNTVDIAANENSGKVQECYKEWGCEIHPISCERSPLNKGTLNAIKEIKKLVEENKYDIVHCHTPIAAMCTRLACRKIRKSGTRVFYTAHGFHFYKGAPLKNWLIYYPIEKICSYFTDVLITINKEDYRLAQKKMKAKKIEYVHGVGLDTSKFKDCTVDVKEKRSEIGVPDEATLFLSVGELNQNKNHETVIRAISQIENKNIHYAVAGRGNLEEHLRTVAKECGISDRVHILGRRTDVAELYKAADIYVHPSFREGLSVSLMEAMASGLPCVVSKIRGNVDLIDENGGELFDPHNVDECRNAIELLLEKDLKKIGEHNMRLIEKFEVGNVNRIMRDLYLTSKV